MCLHWLLPYWFHELKTTVFRHEMTSKWWKYGVPDPPSWSLVIASTRNMCCMQHKDLACVNLTWSLIKFQLEYSLRDRTSVWNILWKVEVRFVRVKTFLTDSRLSSIIRLVWPSSITPLNSFHVEAACTFYVGVCITCGCWCLVGSGFWTQSLSSWSFLGRGINSWCRSLCHICLYYPWPMLDCYNPTSPQIQLMH
jgi:hypothetical protein